MSHVALRNSHLRRPAPDPDSQLLLLLLSTGAVYDVLRWSLLLQQAPQRAKVDQVAHGGSTVRAVPWVVESLHLADDLSHLGVVQV
mmetsp:Transcript_18607/g.59238  ORF Transcript_18607/g.59238 Transcript_18607/m.59238 type:complete len:86 (-) Transcript_18607:69-326(-)